MAAPLPVLLLGSLRHPDYRRWEGAEQLPPRMVLLQGELLWILPIPPELGGG
ncbi:unnamed protein product [Staurois parvus]|uniref:Uncharacterized protein n=1 Tax=Staurois parvus TaxID=386267 RepID=A0ABN9B496_9NEOB|nr:unnamed protein product [Staurois parvus]